MPLRLQRFYDRSQSSLAVRRRDRKLRPLMHFVYHPQILTGQTTVVIVIRARSSQKRVSFADAHGFPPKTTDRTLGKPFFDFRRAIERNGAERTNDEMRLVNLNRRSTYSGNNTIIFFFSEMPIEHGNNAGGASESD